MLLPMSKPHPITDLEEPHPGIAQNGLNLALRSQSRYVLTRSAPGGTAEARLALSRTRSRSSKRMGLEM